MLTGDIYCGRGLVYPVNHENVLRLLYRSVWSDSLNTWSKRTLLLCTTWQCSTDQTALFRPCYRTTHGNNSRTYKPSNLTCRLVNSRHLLIRCMCIIYCRTSIIRPSNNQYSAFPYLMFLNVPHV